MLRGLTKELIKRPLPPPSCLLKGPLGNERERDRQAERKENAAGHNLRLPTHSHIHDSEVMTRNDNNIEMQGRNERKKYNSRLEPAVSWEHELYFQDH